MERLVIGGAPQKTLINNFWAPPHLCEVIAMEHDKNRHMKHTSPGFLNNTLTWGTLFIVESIGEFLLRPATSGV